MWYPGSGVTIFGDLELENDQRVVDRRKCPANLGGHLPLATVRVGYPVGGWEGVHRYMLDLEEEGNLDRFRQVSGAPKLRVDGSPSRVRGALPNLGIGKCRLTRVR